MKLEIGMDLEETRLTRASIADALELRAECRAIGSNNRQSLIGRKPSGDHQASHHVRA
jgi:hypothetical protein